MTRLKGILFGLCFLSLGVMNANSFLTTTAGGDEELRAELSKMLMKIEIDEDQFNEITLRISFMLNNKGEIIVIATDNSEWDKTLKSRLNYRMIKSEIVDRNKAYSIPITIKS